MVMIVLSLWLCLAKLVELVGLGCAVLVVASLCSAWRPPPPASMKAAAWPAAAFLHSRAAAQLPTQPPPQLLPLKSCRDHNCRSCHRRICIQTNTTIGQNYTPQLQKLMVSACNNTHNKGAPTIPQPMEHKRPPYTTKLKINGCERSHCEQSLNHNHIGCKSAPLL